MIWEAGATWKKFSQCLSLPLLTDFSLGGSFYCEKVPEFVDIEVFLMNHPSIRDLHLYAVQLPPYPWTIPRPTFQNLVKFNGHPFYIVWLLQRVELNKTGLPYLERLGMSPDHEPPCNDSSHFWGFRPQHFEPALKAIARLRRNIVLAFTFSDDRVYHEAYSAETWLECQLYKGHVPKDTIFFRLSNVSTLVIYISWKLKYRVLRITRIIPSWLQCFPNLRHLVVNASSELEDNTDFCTAVRKLCPYLETMVVNRVDMNRQGRGNPWLGRHFAEHP